MTALPKAPGTGPYLYHATSVKLLGTAMFPLAAMPTSCTFAFTPIEGMMSRAGLSPDCTATTVDVGTEIEVSVTSVSGANHTACTSTAVNTPAAIAVINIAPMI